MTEYTTCFSTYKSTLNIFTIKKIYHYPFILYIECNGLLTLQPAIYHGYTRTLLNKHSNPLKPSDELNEINQPNAMTRLDAGRNHISVAAIMIC